MRNARCKAEEIVHPTQVSAFARHRSGARVVMVVGAHFRPALASLEDILLYTVLVR